MPKAERKPPRPVHTRESQSGMEPTVRQKIPAVIEMMAMMKRPIAFFQSFIETSAKRKVVKRERERKAELALRKKSL